MFSDVRAAWITLWIVIIACIIILGVHLLLIHHIL